MKVQTNISIKKYNTFGIDVQADKLIEVNSVSELITILNKKERFFILGGGSNMLLTKNIKETILHINIKGIEIVKDNKKSVYVEVKAGENWHEFVLWSLKHDFGGVENLSLIPGNVGTCPIQNIGAYGVEVKDTIHQVNVIEIVTNKKVFFKNSDCEFGYRNSIFKNKAKNKYIITSVVFKLTKVKHKLNYNYGAIKNELKAQKIVNPTIQDVSKAIIAIRKLKLPDPKKIGNSGSFFKNPIVDKTLFEKIQNKHIDIPFYQVADLYKIPAGWLIEKAGFKGKRFGDTGVHEKQALVLVNYNAATGKEILALAKKIQSVVKKLFYIDLEMEVNIF